MKTDKIIIMNFSDIYNDQNFYKHTKYQFLNCRDIMETNCICSENAEKQLNQIIKNKPHDAIHFIDSGHYNYFTKIWTDEIEKDFVLIVFDHHFDMQISNLNENLNCGNWIIKALNNNHLKRVILIGLNFNDNDLKIKKKYSKVTIFDIEELTKKRITNEIKNIIKEYPIYISIDEDVMSSNIIKTNWSQGSMSQKTLFKLLRELIINYETIGLDICGACCNELEYISSIHKDDEFNLKLLNYLKMLSK